PLIWRRFASACQTALGWSDEHLHRFVIHGRAYGEDGYADPQRVPLADLCLRVRERFLYEYDFTDGWQHDVRVEQLLPLESGRLTRSASAADAQCRPKTVAGRGRSSSCASTTRRSVSPSGCCSCSTPSPSLT